LPSRIRDTGTTLAQSHLGARDERLEGKRVVVEHPLTLGIGRVVELKSTVEAKTINDVRSHPAAYRLPGFHDAGCHPVFSQMCRCGETGETGTHDHDVFRSGYVHP
jgi:hypothetical protein